MRRLAGGLSNRTLGMLALGFFVLAFILAYQKEPLGVLFRSGDTVTATFPRDYGLVVNRSKVKIAGSEVGIVSGVDQIDQGHVKISMKVDHDASQVLHSQPTAAIRPTTLLGGAYYVDVVPGPGDGRYQGEPIPVERTTIPVELDRVLEAFQPSARKGLQDTVGNLDATLGQGGTPALKQLLHDAPTVLPNATTVLTALRGNRPEVDLTGIVSGLERTGQVLTAQNGQLGRIVDNLATTSAALRAGATPLAQAVATLPQTLRTTRAGLDDLDGTLDRLQTVGESARPAVQELDPLLKRLDPVLADTQPLLDDLRPVVGDLRPTLDDLTPASEKLTNVMNDLGGGTLDRINGPIMKTVLSPWHAKPNTPYAGALFNGNKFYEEVGFLAAHAAALSKYQNNNGTSVGLALGVGGSSLGGVPLTFYQYLQGLSGPGSVLSKVPTVVAPHTPLTGGTAGPLTHKVPPVPNLLLPGAAAGTATGHPQGGAR